MKNESIVKLVSVVTPSNTIDVELLFYSGDDSGNCGFSVVNDDGGFYIELNPESLIENSVNVDVNAISSMLIEQAKIMGNDVSDVKQINSNTFTYIKNGVQKTISINYIDNETYQSLCNPIH